MRKLKVSKLIDLWIDLGGPIIHPSVQSLIITPICPRSLSFRPVLLPPGVKIQLSVNVFIHFYFSFYKFY